MNNWKLIFERSPQHIREFLYMIPPQDLADKSLDEAINYIKLKYKPHVNKTKISNREILDLNESENPYKFNQLRDRVNGAKHRKKECILGELNEAIQTNNSGKINQLIAESCVATTGHLENLSKTIMPLVNFSSITLPRRTILLDSRNRNLSKSNYSWDISPFSANTQGQVNARDTISQIVEIKCSPFRIPIIQGQNMLYYNKIRLGIAEYDNQGIEIVSNSNYITRNYYHFDFTTQVDGNYLELTPVSSWVPGKVISMCDTVTFNFYGNTEKIIFPTDRLQCTYVAGLPTVITAPEPHYLTTGDLVYCDGSLYNDQGYIVAVTSPTQFIINLSTTAPGTTSVYFASRRVQIRLDFICLEN